MVAWIGMAGMAGVAGMEHMLSYRKSASVGMQLQSGASCGRLGRYGRQVQLAPGKAWHGMAWHGNAGHGKARQRKA